MNSKHLNYSDRSDEISEVRRRRSVSELMGKKREAFQRAVFELEEDAVLTDLVRFSGKKALLRKMIEDLNTFEDNYLGAGDLSKSEQDQVAQLAKIFGENMQKIVKNWGDLQGSYSWEQLAGAMQNRMLKIAKVVGLDDKLQLHLDEWFTEYRNQQLYDSRDKLNNEALQAHQQLAYYRSVGGSEEVIENIRKRLGVIDGELAKMPVDPEHAPAFSSLNPNNRIKSSDRVELNLNKGKTSVRASAAAEEPMKKSKWADGEDTVVSKRKLMEGREKKKAEEKKVGGVRGFLKKIPLFGRLF